MSHHQDLFGDRQPPTPSPPNPDAIAPERRFGGDTYSPERDRRRLSSQLMRVWDVMIEGRWMTLAQIAALARPASEPAVSAHLRDFRKAKYGAHTVERRLVQGERNLREYRLIPARRRRAARRSTA